jgi:hypothetical protein
MIKKDFEPNINFSMTKSFLMLIFLVFISGCVLKPRIEITMSKPMKANSLNVTLSKIEIINHQIVITGTNLKSVSAFKINEGSNSSELQIESKNDTSIVANTISHVLFSAGKVFDFVLSNASAATTFTINFSLCDSTLGGKGFNCILTPNDKDV